jgi:hypothetical protein
MVGSIGPTEPPMESSASPTRGEAGREPVTNGSAVVCDDGASAALVSAFCAAWACISRAARATRTSVQVPDLQIIVMQHLTSGWCRMYPRRLKGLLTLATAVVRNATCANHGTPPAEAPRVGARHVFYMIYLA